jgi:hypothetical protein
VERWELRHPGDRLLRLRSRLIVFERLCKYTQRILRPAPTEVLLRKMFSIGYLLQASSVVKGLIPQILLCIHGCESRYKGLEVNCTMALRRPGADQHIVLKNNDRY